MNNIDFPYKKYFMNKKSYYYDNITKFKPHYVKAVKYYLDGITKYYFDVIIGYDSKVYDEIDIFTDYFTEDQRVKALVKYEKLTPYDWYKNHEKEIDEMFKDVKGIKNKIYEKREYVYQNVKEATQFKISCILSIMKYVENDKHINISKLKVLDPSSGWGDRLIGFMGLNVNEYIGYDPNKNLQKGYKNIISSFKRLKVSTKANVICDGFENMKKEHINHFDIVFTSPPYFDVEIYDNDNKQSIKKYNKFELWRDKFFSIYIKNCVDAVKKGGLIFIHISNNREFKIVDYLMNEMKKYNVRKYKYFGIMGASGKCMPIWSWIKK